MFFDIPISSYFYTRPILYHFSETSFEWPEDLGVKKQWKYTGKILGATESGQGDVFLIRQISVPYNKAVLKIYKQTNKDTKRMRSYREMIALRAIIKGK